MARGAMAAVDRHLRALFSRSAGPDLPDGDLLARFAAGPAPDAEAAFRALVERHGPMVRRVCGDLLGDAHEAEDAAQAAFLVLARRARALRKADSVAPFLFGVARRVALKLRSRAARRRAVEHLAAAQLRPEAAEPPDPDAWSELYAELDRLPARYRDPIVLCHLEGLAHEQAARRLGCPVRTLQTRLVRGRQRLREGLRRRGLGPAAAGLLGLRLPCAEVPPLRSESLIRAATTGSGLVAVRPVATEVLRAMLVARLKSAALVLASGGLLATAAVGLTRTPSERESSALPAPAPASPPTLKAGVERIDLPGLPDTARYSRFELEVVDDADGRAIEGAEVEVLEFVDLRFHAFRTDHTGRLRVEYPFVDEPTASVEVRRPGYVPQRFNVGGTLEGDLDRMTIRLRDGNTIGGRVVDEDGRSIRGARVVVTVEAYDPSEKRPPISGGQEILWEVPTTTDGEGRWRCSMVPPGASIVSLQLMHPDYVSGGLVHMGGPGRRTPDLGVLRRQEGVEVMTKGVAFEGVVLDRDRRPISGARVIDSTQGYAFLEFLRETTTDAQGRFRIHLDAEERVTLSLTADGYALAEREVIAEAGGPEVEFLLEPGRPLEVTVVDDEGRLIPGVSVIKPSLRSPKGLFFREWTDTRGRFRRDAPGTDFSVWASKDGYLFSHDNRIAADATKARIVLTRAFQIDGVVRDADTAEPIEEFEMEGGVFDPAVGTVVWDNVQVTRRGNGRYAAALPGDGAFRQLRVKAEGYEPHVTLPEEAKAGKVERDLPLRKLHRGPAPVEPPAVNDGSE